jgi:hypothetical protein
VGASGVAGFKQLLSCQQQGACSAAVLVCTVMSAACCRAVARVQTASMYNGCAADRLHAQPAFFDCMLMLLPEWGGWQ